LDFRKNQPFSKAVPPQAFSKKVCAKTPKTKQSSSLMNLSPNPIGVINRRNGCGTTLFKKGLTENPKKV